MADFPIDPDEAAALGLSQEDLRAPYGQGYSPPRGAGGGRTPQQQRGQSAAAQRVHALKAQQDAQRRAIAESLYKKTDYLVGANAHYDGPPHLTMAELNAAGLKFPAFRPSEALPGVDERGLGIQANKLTADEWAFLGVPKERIAELMGDGYQPPSGNIQMEPMSITAGGTDQPAPPPPQQAMIQELMRRRAAAQAPPQGALASLYEGGR